ncbi:hypothetical protein [Microbacterium sp. AR7-10]|uniref:hypothetical protein n=1 Tax=Microbacterium sp. AR7-10 TaxID=1891970 RepID=UPI0008FC302F|nr:hypothetical protein [Microbacterium sp. AR7-10]OIU84610.1 hypothetical protein BFN01_02145 [Microbacterium sp. AR7-10]
MTDTTPNKFDFDRLTLGEVATIEDLTGYGIGALSVEKPQGKFLAALYMVARRRNGDPTFTFNKALTVSMLDAQAYLGIDTDDENSADDTAEGDTFASAEGEAPAYGSTVTE